MAPRPLTREEVYQRVEGINVVFGKKKKKKTASERNIWKKRSVFFDLPYWRSLDVRHSLDVMHVEKNVCESLVGTLLHISGKTKDGINTRRDLVEIGIRNVLHPQERDGKRAYLHPAAHTLSKEEKRSFCGFVNTIKVPQGYSSNLSKLVSMQDLKITGMKSHDCHVLMQQLLPLAIRGIMKTDVRNTITRLCMFFSAICSKVIDPAELDELENEGYVILSQLEMHFPPSFFDIMVHLIAHLVREIRLCGPVCLRWMYPFERYMKILKGYSKNPYRPEASIVERYVAEEAVEFCKAYLDRVKAVGLPQSRHDQGRRSKGTWGIIVRSMSREVVMQAHLYILNNTDEVLPYLNAHKNMLRNLNPRKSDMQLANEHNKSFTEWFKREVLKDGNPSETIQRLAAGPSFEVLCWGGYDINGYSFYTKTQDDKSTMQNSGVMVVAEAMHFASSKDRNLMLAAMSYYGIIEEIWEVSYTKFKVPVFKCKWVNSNVVQVDEEFGFVSVNLERFRYGDEPFILGSQAKQVFFVPDLEKKKLSIMLQGKRQGVGGDDGDLELNLDETPPFTATRPKAVELDLVDDDYAVRDDHCEGIWEDNHCKPQMNFLIFFFAKYT